VGVVEAGFCQQQDLICSEFPLKGRYGGRKEVRRKKISCTNGIVGRIGVASLYVKGSIPATVPIGAFVIV
jgi:hypothetical protein